MIPELQTTHLLLICAANGLHGSLLVGISLVLMEYNQGKHNLARGPTLVAEKVGQHITKCMDYHQIKTVIILIDFIISSYCRDKVQIVQPSTIYSFNNLFFSQSQITK